MAGEGNNENHVTSK